MALKEIIQDEKVYEIDGEFDLNQFHQICDTFLYNDRGIDIKDRTTERFLFFGDRVNRDIDKLFIEKIIGISKCRLITAHQDYGMVEYIVYGKFTIYFIRLDSLDHPLAYEDNFVGNKIYIVNYENLNGFSFKTAKAEDLIKQQCQ